MQQQPAPSPKGAFTTPKAFRRVTGAHAIIGSLLLADLFGTVFWILLGALAWPPVWWFLRLWVHLLHASLLFDIGIILILVCLGIGTVRQRVQHKSEDSAWGCVSLCIVGLLATLLILFFADVSWMRIPAPGIPATTLEPFPWPVPLSLPGALSAAGLSLLAHLAVTRRYHKEAFEQLLPFSRAHQDGMLWGIIEQAYSYYRRGLSRFAHPPVEPLKTPATFFYYPPLPKPKQGEPTNLERELHWVSGALVINRAYIGPKVEQTNMLLPLLARLLHDYHGPDLLIGRLLRLAQLAVSSAFCSWVLLFPLLVAARCEHHWQGLERDRVLDRDRFAYWCGEGARLRKLLCELLAERQQLRLPDNAVPTLAERIDHLESLLRREARQVKELRAALPSVPTIPPAAP